MRLFKYMSPIYHISPPLSRKMFSFLKKVNRCSSTAIFREDQLLEIELWKEK